MTKIRQYFYLVAGAIAGILPILTFFKVLSSEQAVSLASLVDNFGSLIGAAAAGTAGVILAKQRKDPSNSIGSSPADVVENNIGIVVQTVNDTATAAEKALQDLERVKKVASEAIGDVPVFGQAAQAALDKYLPLEF